jgi:rfaE bifunctional protein kinase chain/domain
MTTQQILAGVAKLRALVVGDICLDRWCAYDPDLSDPSRETGLPRLAVVSTEVTPGAGGTVANNLAALNAARVAVLGVIGDDGNGYELLRALRARGLSTDFMVRDPRLPTFTYTKLLNSHTGLEDRPRVDFIPTAPLPDDLERRILTLLQSAIAGFDVVLLADQAETEAGGVVTSAVRDLAAHLAARHPDKVIWADSRKRIELFRGVIAKPNRDEADEACLRLFGAIDYRRLRKHMETKLLVVTRGPTGVLLVQREGEIAVPALRVEHPVDICGAGDSFSAGSALALAVTGSPVAAARFGNLVASVTIMKRGTGTASPEEVLAADIP